MDTQPPTGEEKPVTGGKKKSIAGGKKKSIAGGKKKSIAGGKKKSIAGGKKKSIAGGIKKSIGGGGKKKTAPGDKSKSGGKDRKVIQYVSRPEPSLEEALAFFSGRPKWESPLSIDLSVLLKITTFPLLKWYNTTTDPLAMKLTNTGFSVVITPLYDIKYHPFVFGGPLSGNYFLSQIHFHWGLSPSEGSEHRIVLEQYPMEAHAVFHKAEYQCHERARRREDGIIVFVYLFHIHAASYPCMGPLNLITKHIESIKEAKKEVYIENFNYEKFLQSFENDYLVYYGWLRDKCVHRALWFICRETIPATTEEINSFKSVLNKEGKPILNNFRSPPTTVEELPLDSEGQPIVDLSKMVYLVSPSEPDDNIMNIVRPRLEVVPEEPSLSATTRKQSETTEKKEKGKESVSRKSVTGKRKSMARKSLAGKRKSMKRKSLAKKK